MGSIITKKCPGCRATYSSKSYAGIPSKDNRTVYGSPIIKCRKCGKVFLDSDYREPAMSGFRDVDLQRISPSTLVYSIGLLLIGLITIGTHPGGLYFYGGLLIMGGGIYMFLQEYLGYNKRMQLHQQQMEESKKRIENPQYVLLLKKTGYPVPTVFIERAERTIAESEESGSEE